MPCGRLTAFVTLVSLFTSPVFAQDGDLPPIRKLDVQPQAKAFEDSGRAKPLVLRSKDEAAKYFSEPQLGKLVDAVDFARQIVLVFAWRGSGQDRLDYAVLESFPEQIVFSFTPGRTRDLRPHVRVLALRSNVKWRFRGKEAPRAKAKESRKVKIVGKLDNHVVAIGGETTGVTVSAGGKTWELDLGKTASLRKRAEKLRGQTVTVTGELRVQQGVEIPLRRIIVVESLSASESPQGKEGAKAGEFLTPEGRLRHPLILRDSQTGFAGESGQLWTVEPDGSWRRQSFLNQMVREPDRRGRFTEDQLRALASALAKYDLPGLPERIGKDPGVNPHVFAISFGKQQTALVGQGGATLPAADPQNAEAPAQRFAELVRVLRRAMQSDAAKEK